MVGRRWHQWRHILPEGVVLSLELCRPVEASFLAWWQWWWSSSSSSCFRFMSPSSVWLLRSLQFGGCFATLLVEVCSGRMLCRLGHPLWVDALPPILCSCGCFVAMVFGSGCHLGRAIRVDALPPSLGWADILPPSFFFSSGECFAVGVHDAVTIAGQP